MKKKTDYTALPTKYYFTVGDLKEALKGVPDSTPVYTADHDHPHYGTNGRVGSVMYLNQKNGDEPVDTDFSITGNYLVIRVG